MNVRLTNLPCSPGQPSARTAESKRTARTRWACQRMFPGRGRLRGSLRKRIKVSDYCYHDQQGVKHLLKTSQTAFCSNIDLVRRSRFLSPERCASARSLPGPPRRRTTSCESARHSLNPPPPARHRVLTHITAAPVRKSKSRSRSELFSLIRSIEDRMRAIEAETRAFEAFE